MIGSKKVGVIWAIALALAAWSAPPAQAFSGPRCGTTLRVDSTLSSDLHNCSGNGLVIGADDITVDLHGHTIEAAPSAHPHAGIVLNGHTGVTVTGGSIAGFTWGLSVVDSRHIVLQDLDVRSSSDKAIVLVGASDNYLSHNRLHDNADAAIGLFSGSDDNVVSHNDMLRNGPQGVENLFSDRNLVTDNMIAWTGSGVILESSDHLWITHNTIIHSVASACEGCGIAIQIYGNSNVVADNIIGDSPRFGIEVDDFQDPGHSPAAHNVLVLNQVTDAGTGIAIGPEAGGVVQGTVLVGNRVSHSQDDGIQLTGPSTGLATSLLAYNLATFNGNYGIETVPGTLDGGHNRAFGNANVAQCLNITCDGHD